VDPLQLAKCSLDHKANQVLSFSLQHRAMGGKDRARKYRRVGEALQAAAAEGYNVAEQAMTAKVQDAEADGRRIIRRMQKDQRELQKLSWHSRVCETGYELVATVAIVLCCVGALPVELLKAAVDWEAGVPGAKYTAMGGQEGKQFDQKRLQYQLPVRDAESPPMAILIWLKWMLFAAGYKLCRGAFAIRGGSHQYMHKDRGWWHSLSVFVCLERRRVRFGCPGRDDFVVTMEAGDVLLFNGNVWHSGLQNADSSAVLFYYFDMDPFAIDHARAQAGDNLSRFGFTIMLDESEWESYREERAGDPEDLRFSYCKITEVATLLMQGMVSVDTIGLDQ
jgi:hypothetical protein